MRRNIVFSVLSVLLALAMLVSIPAFGASNFIKDATNPLIEKGVNSSDFDYAGVSAGSVIFDPIFMVYKMWYTGMDEDQFMRIGYATSPDGLIWTKQGMVLDIGTSTDFDTHTVGGPSVIRESSTVYKMWYTGASTLSPTIGSIGYATSTDGVNWVKQGEVLPIGLNDEWDGWGVLNPNVIKESSTSYKMWYTGRMDDTDPDTDLDNYTGSTLGLLAIGYATSSNGIVWNKYINNPVMEKTANTFENRGVGGASVIRSSSLVYTMYYTGFQTGGLLSEIASAFSTNGIDWVYREPVLEVGPGWEVEGVGDPSVLIRNGNKMMWYTGTTVDYLSALGYAGEQGEPVTPVPASSTAGTLGLIGIFGIAITLFVVRKKSRLLLTDK